MLMIVNPHGGGGRAREVISRAGIERVFPDLEMTFTRYRGHAGELVRGHGGAGRDPIVVVGGDGTVHEAVNALMERAPGTRPPLGLLPGGTGNALARDLHLDDAERARDALLHPRTRTIDLLRVTTPERSLFAFNMVGWGLPARAGIRAERLRLLGSSRYTVAGMIEIAIGRTEAVDFELDGQRFSGRHPAIVVCNTRHIGVGMLMAPRSRLDDGLMDVVALRPAGRWQTLALLRRVHDGSHVRHRDVEYHQVERFSLAPARPGPINVDGEIMNTGAFTIEVVPRSIEVIVGS